VRPVAGLVLIALAAGALAARVPATAWLIGARRPAAQRPLAGGTVGENARIDRPLRVVVIDGLSRADTASVPALRALCAEGLDLVVDVGFPTKSLPAQLVLWSGLTVQQLGARGDNRPRDPPTWAVPAQVPGAVAAADDYLEIAESVGFPVVRSSPWPEVALDAVAGRSPLVLLHALGVDAAAHAGGRHGVAYQAALADADTLLAAARAAAPDAAWLVLADHGHVLTGGHGDAEDEVRRVRACWSPAPVQARVGTEIHLVDVARWIADALGVRRHPAAVGRSLDVAVAHPDRDATLPRPGVMRVVAAAVVLACGVLGTLLVVGRRGLLVALWPAITAILVVILHGVPTLSHKASLPLLAIATVLPCGLASALALRPRRGLREIPQALVMLLGVGAAAVTGLVVLGAPSAVPVWTGLLVAAGHALAIGLATVGVTLIGTWLLGRLQGG
jgi:hypothetical protein